MRKKINRLNKGSIGINNAFQTDGIATLTSQYTDSMLNNNITYDILNDQQNVYEPPSAWRTLPTINVGEQKFAGVYAVFNTDGNFLTIRAQGAYNVDWGDGTTGAFTSNTIAYKQYTQATYSGLTSDVYNNYKTLVIQVTPQAGNTLTSLNFTNKHNQTSLTSHNMCWLDILMSAPELTSLGFGTDNSAGIMPGMVERFRFIGTNKVTSAGALFTRCFSLKKVEFDTTTCTSLYRMFFGCYNLRSVPPFNTANATSFEGMFYNCNSLTCIPWLNTSSSTNFQDMFQNAAALKTIPPIDTSNGTNFGSLFLGASSLTTVPLLNLSKATTISRIFDGCLSLQTIPKFNISNVTNINIAFQNCTSLIKIPQFNPSSALTTIIQAFNGCRSLEELPFFNTSNVTSFDTSFNGCIRLKTIPPYNTSLVQIWTSAFQNCFNLAEIPKLDYSNGVTFSTTFNGCLSMQGGTNFGLTLGKARATNGMFSNCTSLQYLPPLDLSNSVNLNGMFSSSTNLKEVNISGMCTSTAVLNTASLTNTFLNCYALQSITGSINLSGYTGAGFVNVYTQIVTGDSTLEYVGFTGMQQTFTIANCKFGATALNNIYSSLAVVGASGSGSKTITVTGNWGVANDTPSIATSKGWTVTG